MKIRKIALKDAPLMLEWMSDPSIAKFFITDFSNMTLSKVEQFIKSSFDDNKNIHFATVDENDEYLGTVSLKNIDMTNKKAEYAISFRKKAHGTSAAMEGTLQVIDYGFNKLGLHRIYLNVLKDNMRANNFYQKVGFVYEGCNVDALMINGEYHSLNLYAKVNDRNE